MTTPRERQLREALSRLPCIQCGNPDSPLGSHDCDDFRRWVKVVSRWVKVVSSEDAFAAGRRAFEAMESQAVFASEAMRQLNEAMGGLVSGDTLTVTETIRMS